MHYKCHKINSNRCGCYIDYPDWIEKVAINPVNEKDIECFQYAVTVRIDHTEIEKHSEKITAVKHFINKNSWKGIHFPSEKDYWKKF